MTEVIKDQGGEETSTEYFAALLTTLEATDTEDGLAAVVSLLSMVIKTVPQEIIRSRFSKVRCSLGRSHFLHVKFYFGSIVFHWR